MTTAQTKAAQPLTMSFAPPNPPPKPPKKSTPPKPPPAKAPVVKTSWSMYPGLHESVSRLLEEEGLSFTFFAADDPSGTSNTYDTNIMGRFKCRNRKCRNGGWASKVVAITIRMYPGRRYNARVYHQRCQACDGLSQPVPDDSYAERVAYRLKKWSGVEMERREYGGGGSLRPHQSALCEGCKHGHCRQAG